MCSRPRSLRPRSIPVERPDLVSRLLAGDEALFASLVEGWQSGLLRLAEAFTGDAATAEEVVQETWASVLKSIETFGGRSSLRTWVHRVCAQVALGRVRQDGGSPGPAGPAVDPERFDAHGAWRDPPRRWSEETPGTLAGREVMDCIRRVVVTLPGHQRAVVTLRDVQGFSSGETCEILGVTERHQRALLHRARTRLRSACEELDSPCSSGPLRRDGGHPAVGEPAQHRLERRVCRIRLAGEGRRRPPRANRPHGRPSARGPRARRARCGRP